MSDVPRDQPMAAQPSGGGIELQPQLVQATPAAPSISTPPPQPEFPPAAAAAAAADLPNQTELPNQDPSSQNELANQGGDNVQLALPGQSEYDPSSQVEQALEPTILQEPRTKPAPGEQSPRDAGRDQAKGSSFMFRSIVDFYQRKTFCDLELRFSDGRAIACHQLILVPVSQLIALALKQRPESDESATVFLPEFDYDVVLAFVDQVYGALISKGATMPGFDAGLQSSLQLEWPRPRAAKSDGAGSVIKIMAVGQNQVMILPQGIMLAQGQQQQQQQAQPQQPAPIVVLPPKQAPPGYAPQLAPRPAGHINPATGGVGVVSRASSRRPGRPKQTYKEKIAALQQANAAPRHDDDYDDADADACYSEEDDDIDDPAAPRQSIKREILAENDDYDELRREHGLRKLSVQLMRVPVPPNVKYIHVKFNPQRKAGPKRKMAERAASMAKRAKLSPSLPVKKEALTPTKHSPKRGKALTPPQAVRQPPGRPSPPVAVKREVPHSILPDPASAPPDPMATEKKLQPLRDRFVQDFTAQVSQSEEAVEAVKNSDAFDILTSIFKQSKGRMERIVSNFVPISKVFNPSTSTYLIRTIVGVRRMGKLNEYTGRTLAWNDPTEDELPGQFDETCQAFKAVFGFSDLDLFSQQRMYYDGEPLCADTKKGTRVSKYADRVRNKLMTQFKNMPKEELGPILASAEMQEADAKTDPKPELIMNNVPRVNITFVESLPAEQMDGVCVVLANNRLALKCRTFATVKDQLSRACLQTLLDVWSPERLSSTYLNNKYTKHTELLYTRNNIQKLLSTDIPQWLCPDCGKSFDYRTKYDFGLVQTHKRHHRYAEFRCDCDNVSLKTIPERRRHIKLCHSDDKYISCQVCHWVILKANQDKHVEEQHRTFVCETCGKQFPNKKRHDCHVWCLHKLYYCRICGQESTGYNKHLAHETKHKDPLICDQCGHSCSSSANMKTHMKICTGVPASTTLTCEHCGKKCKSRAGYVMHVVTIHQQERHIDCRHGCGKKFKTVNNRDMHEAVHEYNNSTAVVQT